MNSARWKRPKPIEVNWIVVVALCLCAPNILSAQHWGETLHSKADLDLAKAQFDSTWADSIAARGKGVKPFLRWWHFARDRWAYEGATKPPSDVLWKATAKERAGVRARSTPVAPIWTAAAPSHRPLIGGAGRVNRVVVHPSDTSWWVACTPSGGVWQSRDSGHEWALVGEADWAGMGVSDVAFHPTDTLQLLAATGDGDFGSAYAIGLMQSQDGGATWGLTGLSFDLSQTETVQRVHRKAGAPDHILVAASNGLWISTDDGATFEQTLEGLFSDLIPHPVDSAIWYAAERPGKVYRSTDGGWNWSLASGLPSSLVVSRITLAASPSAPNDVWAIAARSSTQGLRGVYRSADAGQTFTKIDNVPNLLGWTVDGSDFGGQGFYDLALAVDPMDADHVVAGGVNLWETWDGGTEWQCIGHWFGAEDVPEVHADHHAVMFQPGTQDVVSAHDGGISRLRDGGVEDLSAGLNIGQVYRFAFSEEDRTRWLSGWQDNGVNLLDRRAHARVIGADGFHCMVDPVDPERLYAAEYFGRTYRSTDAGWSWEEWISSNGVGVDERGDWDTPMSFAPGNPDRIFVAKHRLYWTDDDGGTWSQTSAIPGSEMEVLALAESDPQVAIMARTTQAFLTSNLLTWAAISGLPGLPVTDVLIDPFNAARFWLSFGGYDADERVWFTADSGQSWTSVGDGLPALPINVLELDTASGNLYAGTDAGVYVLPSDGEVWTPYKEGLPAVVCTELGIRYSTGELLLSTYGRGLWRAPLYEVPERDGACMSILGAAPETCGAIPRVNLEFRNAGADTLVGATVLWNETDTVNYGFILPPNRWAALPWEDVLPGDVAWGSEFTARLLSVVAVNGNWSNGDLMSGVDAVASNDVASAIWEHRTGQGPVLFHTTADCRPLESAWALFDSTGTERAQRQHFQPETLTVDTLCLTHGCHDVVFHDQGGNGWSGDDCGMSGQFTIQSIQGGEVWPSTEPGLPADFGHAASLTFCLPREALFGCTDPAACNFNPAAGVADGSCNYACPDPTCPGDLDGDGVHGATDILAALSEFGCSSSCTQDINGDGSVSANDILALLALYGTFCSE